MAIFEQLRMLGRHRFKHFIYIIEYAFNLYNNHRRQAQTAK